MQTTADNHLPMEIIFSFEPMGKTLSPEPGKVILDVGNRLEPGILDHHHFESESSASRLVLQHPEYIIAWLPADAQTVTLVLHQKPDIDCVYSAYLAVQLLRRGTFPPAAAAVADYVTDIDQGRIARPDAEHPRPYEIFEVMCDLIEQNTAAAAEPIRQKLPTAAAEELQTLKAQLVQIHYQGDLAMVEAGFRLFDYIFSRLRDDRPIDLNALFVGDHPFGEEVEILKKDLELYDHDLRDPNTRPLRLFLPLKGSGLPEAVDGLYLRDPKARLFKIYARTDTTASPHHGGFIFLFVEWSRRLGEQKDRSRFVLSVAPTATVDLKGLGDVLNEYEKRALEAKGIPMVGEPRVGYRLPDPWYDGRGHDYTIVDTPRGGSQLEATEIESLTLSFMDLAVFHRVRVGAGRRRLLVACSYPSAKLPALKKRLLEKGYRKSHCRSEHLGANLRRYLFGDCRKAAIFYYEKPLDSLQVEILVHEQGIVLIGLEWSEAAGKLSQMFSLHRQMRLLKQWAEVKKFWSGVAGTELASELTELVHEASFLFAYPFLHVAMEDAHQARDPQFYGRLLHAFLSGAADMRTGIFQINDEDGNDIPLGQYGRLIAHAQGAYLFTNSIDLYLSAGEQKTLEADFFTIEWYLTLNALLQKALLDVLSDDLAETTAEGLHRRGLSQRLQQLRARAMEVFSNSPLFHLTDAEVGETFWQQLQERLQLPAVREQLQQSLEDLAEYVEMQRTSKIDKVLLYLSLLIGPFTLLTDYLGGLLSSRYPSWSQFFTIIGLTYALAVAAFAVFYVINYRWRKN